MSTNPSNSNQEWIGINHFLLLASGNYQAVVLARLNFKPHFAVELN